MNKEEIEKKIQKKIQKKVEQYVNAQKRYRGDSALSKRIEAEIDSLECMLKKLDKEEL
jgi:hypothetical protein